MDDCSKLARTGKPLSEACLAAAAHHIAHDLDLFEQAWRERQTRLGYTLWFILARSLRDFFFKGTRSEDDVLATDFPVPLGKEWAPFAAGLEATARDVPGYLAIQTAANKNVAHLTYSRTVPDDEALPSEQVHRFFTGAAAEWLSRLTPAARVWFGR
jgi:hypothetical protein